VSPSDEYRAAVWAVRYLESRGLGESAAAEALRESQADNWDRLSESEQSAGLSLSVQLYDRFNPEGR
jgi:hypothetical protein